MIRNFKTSSLLKSFLRNTQKTLFARSLPATSLFRPNNPSPFLFAPRFSCPLRLFTKTSQNQATRVQVFTWSSCSLDVWPFTATTSSQDLNVSWWILSSISPNTTPSSNPGGRLWKVSSFPTIMLTTSQGRMNLPKFTNAKYTWGQDPSLPRLLLPSTIRKPFLWER